MIPLFSLQLFNENKGVPPGGAGKFPVDGLENDFPIFYQPKSNRFVTNFLSAYRGYAPSK